MKTWVLEHGALVSASLDRIAALLRAKPDAALALSAGEPCLCVYRALAELSKRGEVSLSRVRFFSVAEYDGLAETDVRRLSCRLADVLLSDTDAAPEHFFAPDQALPEQYDDLISSCGGLDLAVLSLGVNSRFGFNEPATRFDTRTHRQKLTNPTRRELADEFGGEALVPEYGLTMGVKTLTEAGDILVLAEGEAKAKAVFHMLYGRDDSIYPAAFLQIPPEVTVIVDPAAAAQI